MLPASPEKREKVISWGYQCMQLLKTDFAGWSHSAACLEETRESDLERATFSTPVSPAVCKRCARLWTKSEREKEREGERAGGERVRDRENNQKDIEIGKEEINWKKERDDKPQSNKA